MYDSQRLLGQRVFRVVAYITGDWKGHGVGRKVRIRHERA